MIWFSASREGSIWHVTEWDVLSFQTNTSEIQLLSWSISIHSIYSTPIVSTLHKGLSSYLGTFVSVVALTSTLLPEFKEKNMTII